MAKEKDPSFKLYIRDWMHGTRWMNYAQKGFYLELLCDQWDHGFIEADKDGLPVKYQSKEQCRLWESIKTKFDYSDGKLINAKLERVRLRAKKHSEKQAENGSKGGRPPKPNETQIKPNGNPNETQTEPNKNPLAHAHANSNIGGTGEIDNYPKWIHQPEQGLLFADLKQKATTYGWRGKDFDARLDKMHNVLSLRKSGATIKKTGNHAVNYHDDDAKAIHYWFVSMFCEPNSHPSETPTETNVYPGSFFK